MGILDFFGGSSNPKQGMGILGGAAQSPGWASALGMFGAGLADAGASFSGHPADATNLKTYGTQFRQDQMRTQLMQALNSDDPATRQQAYSAAAMLGVDTKPFQQQRASSQLPSFLASMKPQQATLDSQSAPLPGGGNITTAPISFEAPGKSISDAIQAAPPELQSQYAPKLLDLQMAADTKANEPFTLKDGEHRFVNGADTASLPEKNTPNQPFNVDGTPNKAYQKWEIDKASASRADTGWQVVNDPNTNLPYRYNARTAQSTDMVGTPIQVSGYGKIATNNPRSAVGIYMAQWKQEHPKASASDIATAMNTFTGQQSEQHALGTISARVGSANNGLDTVLDQSNAAYAKLPRGSFVPFNKLQQLAATDAFSTPEQADAYAADTGAINMWAKSINPSGVLTVENARRGEQMLSQAQSPEAHQAVIERMRKEGQAAKAGVDKSRGIVPQPSAAVLPRLPQSNATKVRVFNPATGRLE